MKKKAIEQDWAEGEGELWCSLRVVWGWACPKLGRGDQGFYPKEISH